MISIVVVYSPGPREVNEIALTLEQGCTVVQALASVDRLAESKGLGFLVSGFGIWGKKVSVNQVLQNQDRLEIYRALNVDPKEARRQRFVKQGAKKAAGLFAQRRAGAKAGY
jgi:putative ubiquitin-RnfH superfamily antitoxin RatB of RatAB toxin-antitoxin module